MKIKSLYKNIMVKFPKHGSMKDIGYKSKCLVCGYLSEDSVDGVETENVNEIEKHIRISHRDILQKT